MKQKSENKSSQKTFYVWIGIVTFLILFIFSSLFVIFQISKNPLKNKLTDITKVPNYMQFIYLQGLEQVKPEAVTIIH